MAEKHEEEIGEGEDPDYKVGKKVSVNELMNMDQEDESLKKYKEALLGAAAKDVFSRKYNQFIGTLALNIEVDSISPDLR